MTLRQLTYFLEISRQGSFLKAAQTLYIAQSALSHQIALLEQELGAVLFHRSRRGVELTQAGEVLQAHAGSILRQVQDARSSIASLTATPAGRVVVGIPHSVSNALALPLLQLVRAQLPKVDLELTEELTGNLFRQLSAGQLHMAVLFDDGTLDDLEVTPLVNEALSLISPADLAPKRRTISLQDALSMPLILPAPPHGVRPIIETAATRLGLGKVNVVADISSISILRTSLLAGMGHTLLPVMPLKSDIDSGALMVTAIKGPSLVRTVCLCRSPYNPPSAAANSVWQALIGLSGALRKSGQWPGASAVKLDPLPSPV